MKKLAAILCAFAAAGAVVAALAVSLPPQGQVDHTKEYGYVSSGVKSESVDFTLAAAHADSYFLFGSSELATMPWMVPTAPDRVFQEYDCGMQFMYTGEAYDQSLWMAIAAGAYAEGMPNKKVAIIVSPQWFLDGGLEPGIFKMRFSYNLYERFCENPGISDATKGFVRDRLAAEGVDQALIDAGARGMPQDQVNAAAYDAMNDLRLRNALGDVRAAGTPVHPPAVDRPPDFDALRGLALEEAQKWSTNNDYGVYDEYWTAYLESEYPALKGRYAGETLTDTTEYDDFGCFLDVCEEAGLDPYVIMMPVNGKWYDYAGLSKDVRAAFYERIRALCDERGEAYLDLSPHEYDPYYMRDIMHFGWLGWLDVEQGFMGFVEGDR